MTARTSIPIAYLELMIELCADHGLRASQLLAGLPIDPAIREIEDARMSSEQWTRVVLRALELTNEPGLGYAYGLRMRPSVHGIFGFAAMTSSTMRQAFEITTRYARTRQAHFEFELFEGARECRLIVRDVLPIPVARMFFVENLVLGLARATAMLLGRELDTLHELSLAFDVREPRYYRTWRDRIPRARFRQPENALCFPHEVLEARPVLADPRAAQQAIALCERELTERGDDAVARVRAELERTQGQPRLPPIARRLGMSDRTLKRRLKESGASFSSLASDARRRRACEMLARTELPIRAIATRLGYESPGNFTRAFIAWTGESPTRYRGSIDR